MPTIFSCKNKIVEKSIYHLTKGNTNRLIKNTLFGVFFLHFSQYTRINVR